MRSKMKVTKKAVMESFRHVYSVGYCKLQFLFSMREPDFYTCGVYGWKADIYDFGGIAIVTGYQPFGEDVPLKIVEKYEVAAQKINENPTWDYSRQKKELNELIHEFLADVRMGLPKAITPEEAKKIWENKK